MSLKHFCKLGHFINVSNICCISMKRSRFVKRVSKLTPKVLGCKGLPLTNALAYLISSSVTKEFFHKIALVQQIIEIVPWLSNTRDGSRKFSRLNISSTFTKEVQYGSWIMITCKISLIAFLSRSRSSFRSSFSSLRSRRRSPSPLARFSPDRVLSTSVRTSVTFKNKWNISTTRQWSTADRPPPAS